MNLIRIDNNYSYFLSQDDDIKQLLWRAMRCRPRGYFHNAQYRRMAWDGYTDYFKKETGRFLTGLLPEVRLALKHKGVDYEVEDRRGQFQFAVDSVGEDFLPGVTLRDYQVDYVNQVIRNKRGLIPSPTSSGKTSVLKAVIKALPPKTPTLVLANKKSLVDQNYEEIKSLGIDSVGRLYGDQKDPNYITCATSQSAHLLKPVLGKIRVLLVDEVHEMMSKVPKQIYAALKNCPIRVGMSATAFKWGGKDQSQKFEVRGWFGPVFLTHSTEDGKLTTQELQSRQILSSAACTFIRIDRPQLPYEIYIDAVTRGIAENDYFHGVVRKLVKTLTGRTLIIVERIEHGDRLQEMMPGALWVRGKDDLKTRRGIIDRLKNEAHVVAIATSGIFNTGINVFVHNLVNAAGGQADHQIIQRFGRGLRRTKDKTHLQYFDFLFEINDYLNKHSLKRIDILKQLGYEVTIRDES